MVVAGGPWAAGRGRPGRGEPGRADGRVVVVVDHRGAPASAARLRLAGGRLIWVTETGLATWDLESGVPARHDLQAEKLAAAAAAPAERVYQYSLIDLSPERAAIEGFHVDENEYHLGLVTWAGEEKPAYRVMQRLLRGESPEGGEEDVSPHAGETPERMERSA